jgi:hypothetical protein
MLVFLACAVAAAMYLVILAWPALEPHLGGLSHIFGG